LAGGPIAHKVLQGVVVALGPDVCDLALGDEVLFRRPEGGFSELAFMDQDLILARLQA
jgi:NADPH:quinone reductase-like Zn-dependent oxidoreductase